MTNTDTNIFEMMGMAADVPVTEAATAEVVAASVETPAPAENVTPAAFTEAVDGSVTNETSYTDLGLDVSMFSFSPSSDPSGKHAAKQVVKGVFEFARDKKLGKLSAAQAYEVYLKLVAQGKGKEAKLATFKSYIKELKADGVLVMEGTKYAMA